MKRIRKAVRTSLLMIAGFVGVLIVIGLAAMEWPTLAINPHTLELARRYASRSGDLPQVRWKEARVQAAHRGLFSNQVSFHFTDFCFEKKGIGHGCAEDLEAAFAYGFSRALPRITELGPLAMKSGQIDLDPRRIPDQKKAATPSPSEIPSFVSHAHLEPIQVEIKKWSIASPPLEGTSRIRLARSREGFQLSSESTFKLKDSPGTVRLQASSPSDELDFRKTKPISFRTEGTYDAETSLVNVNLNGTVTLERGIHAEIAGKIRQNSKNGNRLIGGPLSLLEINPVTIDTCSVDWSFPKDRKEESRIESRCHVAAELAHLRPLAGRHPEVPPRRLGAILQANATLPGPKEENAPIRGHLAIHPVSDFPSAVRFEGQITSDFVLVSGESAPRELRAQVDLKSAVPKFRKLTHALADTPIAVPAPIRVLDGTAEFDAKGRADLERGGEIALALASHLSHRPDHLELRGTGKIDIGPLRSVFAKPAALPKTDVTLDVLLSNIRLTLPKTGITTPPSQVLPDSRIHAKLPTVRELETQPKKKTVTHLHYAIRVRTPKSHPVRIDSEFLDQPIALGLDLHAQENRAWMGWAEINGNREPVGIPKAQMAGQAGEPRPGPKLPFGFSELITSFLTGIPLEAVSEQPKRELGVNPTEESRGNSLIELRRRY